MKRIRNAKNQLMAWHTNQESTFYEYDKQGNMLSEQGLGKVATYEYDAFGNTIEFKEEGYNPFRYAGEQYDTATGQYCLRARFYNPVIARFTQEEVYRGDGLNLYAYVSNNPVKYVDPSEYKECKVDAVQGTEMPVEGISNL